MKNEFLTNWLLVYWEKNCKKMCIESTVDDSCDIYIYVRETICIYFEIYNDEY